MCLTVEKIKHSYKYEIVNGERMIPVWKILLEHHISPYFIYSWTYGWNFSNYQCGEDRDFIYRGFHFFLSKKDATLESFCRIDPIILKMYVRKEDIIARGIVRINNSIESTRSLVASRAYFPN